MKKIGIHSLLLILAAFLNSCDIGMALVATHNQNATEVYLSGDNFKVIDKVSGSSEMPYLLEIGGLNNRQLYENAYSTMIKNANLLNCSQAIMNVTTEEQVSGFAPFYLKRTITVSAQVVEFTK